MPATNVRSRNGCYRCRARKIKCDESQPECGRCRSAGFPCPGYKSPTEITFRSMNRRVEHKVAFQVKKQKASAASSLITPRPSEASSSSASPGNSPASSSTPTTHFRPWETSSNESDEAKRPLAEQGIVARRSPVMITKREEEPPLCVPMSTDWRDPALCRFFNDYVVEANEVKVSPGYLNNLQKIYGEGSDDIITNSVSAVSLASFSNQVRSDDLLIRGRKQYGKALLLVKRALSNPKTICKDGTLAGVFFLNMYEMISGDKPMMNQWGTHADALSMLLRLRADTDLYTSERSGGIARGAHGVIIFKNLLRRLPPGSESDAWARSVPANEPWAQVGLATIRIAKLIPVADSILMGGTVADANGYGLLQTINMFEAEDRSFEQWAADSVSPYTYGVVTRDELLAHGNYAGIPLPEVIHYYHDSWITGFWNVYRFARVVLLQTLAQLTMRVSLYPELAPMNPRMEAIGHKAVLCVDAMVNDIFSSIPYTLGKVGANGWILNRDRRSLSSKAISGYTSVWPLKLALMVRTLTDAQRKYIFDQLAYIEGSLGIRQAKPNI